MANIPCTTSPEQPIQQIDRHPTGQCDVLGNAPPSSPRSHDSSDEEVLHIMKSPEHDSPNSPPMQSGDNQRIISRSQAASTEKSPDNVFMELPPYRSELFVPDTNEILEDWLISADADQFLSNALTGFSSIHAEEENLHSLILGPDQSSSGSGSPSAAASMGSSFGKSASDVQQSEDDLSSHMHSDRVEPVQRTRVNEDTIHPSEMYCNPSTSENALSGNASASLSPFGNSPSSPLSSNKSDMIKMTTVESFDSNMQLDAVFNSNNNNSRNIVLGSLLSNQDQKDARQPVVRKATNLSKVKNASNQKSRKRKQDQLSNPVVAKIAPKIKIVEKKKRKTRSRLAKLASNKRHVFRENIPGTSYQNTDSSPPAASHNLSSAGPSSTTQHEVGLNGFNLSNGKPLPPELSKKRERQIKNNGASVKWRKKDKKKKAEMEEKLEALMEENARLKRIIEYREKAIAEIREKLGKCERQ